MGRRKKDFVGNKTKCERAYVLHNSNSEYVNLTENNTNILLNNWFNAVFRDKTGESIRAMIQDPHICDPRIKNTYKIIDTCIEKVSDSRLNPSRKSFLIGRLLNLYAGTQHAEYLLIKKEWRPKNSPFIGYKKTYGYFSISTIFDRVSKHSTMPQKMINRVTIAESEYQYLPSCGLPVIY